MCGVLKRHLIDVKKTEPTLLIFIANTADTGILCNVQWSIMY